MDQESSYNILMIEDDLKIVSMVKDSLEARSHKVTVISNGKQALRLIDKVNRDSFDVVLLDINLPDANGFQILAKIRSLPATENYIVIMLTAIDDDLTESRALLDGADDYIVKPCTIRILLAHIEANIRKKAGTSFNKLELPFSDGNFEELTPREVEILELLVKGYSNKEIANITVLSELTVGNHVRNIFKKLNVNSRIQAAVMALKYNLIQF